MYYYNIRRNYKINVIRIPYAEIEWNVVHVGSAPAGQQALGAIVTSVLAARAPAL